MKVLIATDARLPSSGDLRVVRPSEVLTGVPQEPCMLVDVRDLQGQLSALIGHLVAVEYSGLVVLMTPFVHVPICMGPAAADSSAELHGRCSAMTRSLIEDVVPAYLAAAERRFEEPSLPTFVGVSPATETVRGLFCKIAQQDRSTVLISGASGTGKQIVARGLHDCSPRSEKPFVELNCATLPDTLLENELFGRERGAYTDARTARQGLIEVAGEGTLFLDEIGNITERLQMALLKVIEQKTYRRVGGDEERTSSARFLAATSRDLEAAIASGEFRSDLYYRLNVFTINLPDLRQRDADAVILTQYFAQQFAQEYDRPFSGLTGQVAALLLRHEWPGNVRQLKNTIERAVVLNDDPWLAPGSFRHSDKGTAVQEATGQEPPLSVDHTGAIRIAIPPWGISLNAIEKAVLQAALDAASYNITKTAKLLFVSRDTVRYRMKKYGLNGHEDA